MTLPLSTATRVLVRLITHWASPVALVPLGVPTLCVHGRADDIVPIDQSERWVAAATAVGDAAELAAFEGDHFDVLDPAHRSWQAVVERLDSLAP